MGYFEGGRPVITYEIQARDGNGWSHSLVYPEVWSAREEAERAFAQIEGFSRYRLAEVTTVTTYRPVGC